VIWAATVTSPPGIANSIPAAEVNAQPEFNVLHRAKPGALKPNNLGTDVVSPARYWGKLF